MKSRSILLVVFLALCIAQLYFPAKVVFDHQTVLDEGTVWKFQCEPVDPNDPFRGKYITLRFNQSSILTSDSTNYERDESVYLILKEDSIGFAKVNEISRELPLDKEYIKTTIISSYKTRSRGNEEALNRVRFNLPFNRFYMEESKALPAEQAYRDAQRSDDLTAYALVKVKKGNAVLENVYLNEMTIKEYVETRYEGEKE